MHPPVVVGFVEVMELQVVPPVVDAAVVVELLDRCVVDSPTE